MIVVTAPTSGIGRLVLDGLFARKTQVRVIARDPAHLPASTRERAKIVQGLHRDAAVVNEVFRGAG